MAEQKKMVEAITPMEEDFAKWYTDIVKKAELMDYTSVRGCMVIEPYGWAIWENIQHILDAKFKELGHENVSMPMFIPESLLNKEKEHVQGFAPEVAWVTMGGNEKLQERLCVRPTSETLFCDHYAKVIQSWRDLPKLYNQWCSVVRWEKTTRPFLRSVEFHWQEGHTMHETAEEAEAETERMLGVYADFCENELAIPVIKGRKTDKEKFSGAVATYTIEAMMHDGKALQSGTSHYFGDGFAKAFNVTFQGRDNSVCHPFQTSWGMSTRIIGGVIMTHGDNDGLVLPPAVAPIQVIIVPVAQHKPGVLDKAQELRERLKKTFRVRVDDSDQSPGWKFAQYEMKGVPLRLEIGPKDIEKNQCVLVRRHDRQKVFVPLDQLEQAVAEQLEEVRRGMYEKALARRESMTYSAKTLDELQEIADSKPGFIKAMWCGDSACEEKLKEVAGVSSRCMPFEQEHVGDTCVCCGKPAKSMVYWGKAY
ncbi:proline--tRNA ligase [Caproiciproducens galactitolivorans]|uniref:Proline--tRNA ligase n=1 Tax=Caproiciproducens galactitolivorans TaxID=642589 RepID=A0ABT4BSW1_9FIRM|nr:proline--tRNA ligase [Caproiciproducens galactitolivorans]MCY1713880.1 proline--tRNA ligase [Caproiciproducens galactitolivorans]